MKRYNSATSQRGIALMLVLSTIVLLTAFIVEFAYDTNISAHLATNDRQRLQAEYLAQSSYSFMLLELKYDKIFRQAVQSQNLSQYIGDEMNAPLCKVFPISTGLIRFFVLGEGEAPQGSAKEVSKMVSISAAEGAKEFLDFEGDFDGECTEESTRINLNALALFNPDAPRGEDNLNDYDRYKKFLVTFLKLPSFEKLFTDADYRIEDIVTNIADWIDSNEQINPDGGSSSSSERGPYEKLGAKYPVRSGKILSRDEAYLIAGVYDDWFGPLENSFTIYGASGLNICGSNDFVIESMIIRFLQSQPDFSAIRVTDSEVMERLVTAIHDGCAQGGGPQELKKQVATSLLAALSQYAKSPSLTVESMKSFTDSITTESSAYTLLNTGRVGDTTVRLKTVVDITETDPQKWKLLYWRMY